MQMKLLLIYFCLCITALSSGKNKCEINVEGYYWKDYYGTIPPDALQGGVDSKGRILYIARVFFDVHWVPGCIYEGNPVAHFEMAGAHETRDNIMILCTKNPEKFEWIKVRESFDKITGQHIMVGGYESSTDITTVIARAPINSELTIGKAFAVRYGNAGYYGARDGVSSRVLDFEILIFNPDTCNTINY